MIQDMINERQAIESQIAIMNNAIVGLHEYLDRNRERQAYLEHLLNNCPDHTASDPVHPSP